MTYLGETEVLGSKDYLYFAPDPSAGANVVSFSQDEISDMTPEQQAGLNPALTKKSILPVVAMVAATVLFLS